MYKVLVFAGTTEGYEICRFLADHKIETKGFVATEYGSKSLTENEFQSSIFHPHLPPSLFRPEDWMQQPWRRPFYRRNRKWC